MAELTTLVIEITTGHCLGGEGHDVYPGKILIAPKDLSIADARKKVRLGYARIVPSAPEPGPDAETPDPETPPFGPAIVTDGDPAPDSRDPAIEAHHDRRGQPRAGARR